MWVMLGKDKGSKWWVGQARRIVIPFSGGETAEGWGVLC